MSDPFAITPRNAFAMIHIRLNLTGATFVCLTAIAPLLAADPAIQSALEAPRMGVGTTLREIRALAEPRILPPPAPKDLAEWQTTAERLRRDMLEQIVFRGRAKEWRESTCGVAWLDTIPGGPGYRIRKFRYEALPGMWLPGLLYLPDKLQGNVPVAVHVNGHAPEGKAVDYKQLRSINLAKRGLLVLNLEWFGMGQLRTPGFAHGRMNQLDLCGASGLAPFYLALSRAVDIALKLEHADPARIAVSGLSGGGWQTILIAGLDPRITLANPVAGYGGFRTNILLDDMGDSEQAPADMALVADYTHLTALRAPRPTLLTYNAGDDCCFKSGHALPPLVAAARPIFELHGAGDQLRTHVNHRPGTHNYDQDNREQYYAAIGDYFYPGDRDFARAEISSVAELKTAVELDVPLPADNVDFNRLAQALVASLPASPGVPADRAAAEAHQRQRRDALRSLLRVPTYSATAAAEKPSLAGSLQVVSRVYQCGESWTVPAVEFSAMGQNPERTVILVADAGRASLGEQVARLVTAGQRVLAVDPLLVGEAKVKAQDPEYTYALFLSTVGERPLGIQAAQLAAVTRAMRTARPAEPVTLSASGPRMSLAALVAAALEPEAIAGVELSGSLASLRELVERNEPVETLTELFAFGLLAEFDVASIAALVVPRSIVVRDSNERMRQELAPLAEWYRIFGSDHRPVE